MDSALTDFDCLILAQTTLNFVAFAARLLCRYVSGCIDEKGTWMSSGGSVNFCSKFVGVEAYFPFNRTLLLGLK